MTKQQTKFKKAVAIAKQLRKSNPALKYTDAIKKAFKSLGSTTHKDTKSHNVNIRLVSGVGAIRPSTAKKLAYDWHGGQWSALYSYASTGKYFPEDHNKYIKEISKDLDHKGYTKTQYNELKKLYDFFVSQHKKHRKVGATLLLEKGETARTKPKSIKTITRTKTGTFKKWKTLGNIRLPKFGSATSTEIEDLMMDSTELYWKEQPILKQLYLQYKKGNFTLEKAKKSYRKLVDTAVKLYKKENKIKTSLINIMPINDRNLLAMKFAIKFENHLIKNDWLAQQLERSTK